MPKECTSKEFHNRIKKLNLQWFAKDGEGGEKTEPATAKKLKDAREEGKVAKSKELTAAFSLIVLFLCLKIFISYVGESLINLFPAIYNTMADFVRINEGALSAQAVSSLFFDVIIRWLLIVLPFFAFGFVITILVSIVQLKYLKESFQRIRFFNYCCQSLRSVLSAILHTHH